MNLVINKITPIQKKIIIVVSTLGIGFFSGIKFCDVKIKARIGEYQIQIDKLKKNVDDRDKTIAVNILEKEQSFKEAQIAKEKSDVSKKRADDLEKSYKKLIAQIPSNSSIVLPNEPTSLDVANSCNEVIESKNQVITNLDDAFKKCVKSKITADKVIKDLQLNETDLKTSVSLEHSINSDLTKRLESQNRRKWLYFVGGIATAVLAKHVKDRN